MTILIILLVMLGIAAVIMALVVARRRHRVMAGRIHLVSTPTDVEPIASTNAASPAAIADEYAKSIFGFGLRYRWGMKAGATRLGIFGSVAAIAVFVTVYLLLGAALWFAGIAALIVLWLLPHMILRHEQHKAETQFVELFADAVDMVVRMLRAGLPVTAAIRATATDGPAPVNEVFGSVSDQVEIGIPFDEALVIAADQVGIQDFRFFAAAVTLQRATGGNLAATLETLSDIIRRRRAGRMKARAVTAEVRATAYVLAAIPFVIIGGLLILNPQYLAPLVDDPRGNIIAGAATGLLIAAFVTMRQMMRSVTKI